MTTTLKAKVKSISDKNLVLQTTINKVPQEVKAYYYFIDQVKVNEVYVFVGDVLLDNKVPTFNVESVLDLQKEDEYVSVSLVGKIRYVGKDSKQFKVSEKGYVGFQVEVNTRGKVTYWGCNYKITDKQKSLFSNLSQGSVVTVSGNLAIDEYKGNKQLKVLVKQFNILDSVKKENKNDDTDFFSSNDTKAKDDKASPFDFE